MLFSTFHVSCRLAAFHFLALSDSFARFVLSIGRVRQNAANKVSGFILSKTANKVSGSCSWLIGYWGGWGDVVSEKLRLLSQKLRLLRICSRFSSTNKKHCKTVVYASSILCCTLIVFRIIQTQIFALRALTQI